MLLLSTLTLKIAAATVAAALLATTTKQETENALPFPSVHAFKDSQDKCSYVLSILNAMIMYGLRIGILQVAKRAGGYIVVIVWSPAAAS